MTMTSPPIGLARLLCIHSLKHGFNPAHAAGEQTLDGLQLVAGVPHDGQDCASTTPAAWKAGRLNR